MILFFLNAILKTEETTSISLFSGLRNNDVPTMLTNMSLVEQREYEIAFLTRQLLLKNEQVRSLTEFREKFPKIYNNVIPANIISRRNISNVRKTFYIDRGMYDGVELGDIILFGHSLIGFIIEKQQYSSQVLSIADPSVRIPVELVGNINVAEMKTQEEQEASENNKNKEDIDILYYGKAICCGKSQKTCYLKWLEKTYQPWKTDKAYVLTATGTTTDGILNFPVGLVVGIVDSPYQEHISGTKQAPMSEGIFWNIPVQICDVDSIHTVIILKTSS
ncbi:MAG TPA: rod shape-determining protein MreC [Planctomycetota bacterium]|nr:rod shape-determining protein MreC [Planctomycetota bacterium]HRU52363.1 rod shape-determining protein MreC [Planctomycetota bacterium]